MPPWSKPVARQPYGIITRTNLLHAVMLDSLPATTAIGEVATSPVISVSKGDYLFNAMLAMTRHKVKRVSVTDGDRISGYARPDPGVEPILDPFPCPDLADRPRHDCRGALAGGQQPITAGGDPVQQRHPYPFRDGADRGGQ